MQNCIYHICGFIVLILVQHAFSQKYVGDSCVFKKTGAPGKCEVLRNCSTALEDLRSKIYPQSCGFQGRHPVVCCQENQENDTAKEPLPVVSTTMMPTTTLMPIITLMPNTTMDAMIPDPAMIGEKSKQKCQEYGSYYHQSVTQVHNISIRSCQYNSSELIRESSYALGKEFPHMAAIGFDGEDNKQVWDCGGALISERFVLTAAHCLYHFMYGEPRHIRLGDLILNSNSDDAAPQQFKIIAKFSHPSYKPPLQYDDIALLKMDHEARFNAYVRPACLVTNPSLTISLAIVSSWNKMNYSINAYQKLLVQKLEYVTAKDCNEVYGNDAGNGLEDGIIESKQFCASSASKTICQRNSGGPLQIYHEEFCLYNIVGITSFAKPCGVANVPGVYTKVSSYIEWIEETVWP